MVLSEKLSRMNSNGISEKESRMATIPRGIEVLVKKAAVDPEFRQLLLEKRGQAAGEIDLDLTDAERNILSSMPAEHLEKIIDNTKVEPEQRKIFLGRTAMLMLAAAGLTGTCVMSTVRFTAGIDPERVRKMQMERSDDIDEANDPNGPNIYKHTAYLGMRIDRPPEGENTWLRRPSEQKPKPGITREYVVQRGDSVWLIAANQLGDASRYKEILKLNTDLPWDGRDLKPGMKLAIPAR